MNPATRPLSLTASPPLPNPPGNDGPRGAIDHEPSGASIGPRGVVVVGDSGDSGLLDGGRLNDLPRLAVIQQRKALAAHERDDAVVVDRDRRASQADRGIQVDELVLARRVGRRRGRDRRDQRHDPSTTSNGSLRRPAVANRMAVHFDSLSWCLAGLLRGPGTRTMAASVTAIAC